MKAIVLSAAAIAMVASAPALAAAKSGDNGIGTYEITGTAASFCVLGPVAANSVGGGTRNATIDYITHNSAGYAGGTSDAMVNITKLQDENDHADAWRAVINMHHSVCNSAYTVTASSANGGLQYQGQESGGADFVKKLDYTLQANFGGHTGTPKTATNMHNGARLLHSNQAGSGVFKLIFDGSADNSQYLLSGDYSDTVVVTLSPA